MPLRCLDGAASIHAFDLSSETWAALTEENRVRRHLQMPCCAAPVTLKKSRLGTQFFAHKKVGECTTAPESEEHLKLKQLAVEVARAHGWEANTEVAEGVLWRADVLATKGTARVAIEIQWSPQTDEETLRRQRRYEESGVRGLWLLRQRKFAVDPSLPAARVSVDESGFVAHVPSGYNEQSLTLLDFLAAAFTRRLHFGVPLNLAAGVTVSFGNLWCWKCGAETKIIQSVEIAYGPRKYRFDIAELGEHPDLFAIVSEHIPADSGVGIIKRRQSRAQDRSYLSNGCSHCDALIGQNFEHEAELDAAATRSFSIVVDERWHRLLQKRSSDAWGVYDNVEDEHN